MPSSKKKTKANEQKPLVSVCTPTFNRRPFIKSMLQCFRNQTYPKTRIEWIIVDDGTDKIKDLLDAADIPQIKYFAIDKKMPLGEKRNFMHKKATGAIIVYMDDDDYYPPERISHAVERLEEKKEALCAGSSEIYVYFKHIHKMYQAGPYGPNHATAGTFAFRRELLDQTSYEDRAALAEEKHFLKNYTIPFVQLDPLKTILVFSHTQNTFDKKILLEMPNDLFRESPKTVDMFIRKPFEKDIRDYFMEDIDKELEKYLPGDPIFKPDVLVQMKEIDIERKRMMKEYEENHARQQTGGVPQIMVKCENGPDRALNQHEIINLVQQFQNECLQKDERLKAMEKTLDEVRRELIVLKLEKAKFEQQQKKTVHFATETPAKEAVPAPKEPTKASAPALKEPAKEKTIVHVNPPFRSKLTPEIMVF